MKIDLPSRLDTSRFEWVKRCFNWGLPLAYTQPMVAKSLLDDVLALPVCDRMELYDRLFESLQADASAFPTSAEQRAEVDRRAEEMKRDPALGSSWAEVKARVWPKR